MGLSLTRRSVNMSSTALLGTVTARNVVFRHVINNMANYKRARVFTVKALNCVLDGTVTVSVEVVLNPGGELPPGGEFKCLEGELEAIEWQARTIVILKS